MKEYQAPKLTRHEQLRDITKTGSPGGPTGPTGPMAPSVPI